VTLHAGERIVSACCGGGGYGSPDERDIARVAKDVREGWITRERAETVYGVVFAGDGTIDGHATEQRRAQIRGEVPA
jgi:N-methylhydantoinase B/oxoprolinase/acetone carboxylase alpha subunit